MTILIVAYLNSEKLIKELESIICYDKFQITETNLHYRVFKGEYDDHAVNYFKRLFHQLSHFAFDIEDSIFLLYPKFSQKKFLTISTLVIKRKGNRNLRQLEIR